MWGSRHLQRAHEGPPEPPDDVRVEHHPHRFTLGIDDGEDEPIEGLVQLEGAGVAAADW